MPKKMMTGRRILFWMHLISGVIAGTLFLSMAATGAMLSFEPQLSAFSERNLRKIVLPEAKAVKLSIEDIFAKAAAANPEKYPSGILLKSDPTASAVIFFGKEGGSLYVNPYNGEILGKGSKLHNFLHQVEDFHRRLGAGENGRKVTGNIVLFLLFMVLSGFYLWWPRNWNLAAFKAVLFFNPKAEGKARDFNWHNTIGFWCMPMLLITALTGTIMAHAWANNLLFYLSGSEPPAIYSGSEPAAQPPTGAGKKHEGRKHEKGEHDKKSETPGLRLNDFFEKAVQQAPGWVSINLRLPKRGSDSVTASIEEPSAGYVHPRSQLTFDTATGEVKKWEPYSESSRGKKWRFWVKNLHTGEAWGPIGQTIAFLSALGLGMLVWTGFAMAWRRFLMRQKAA